VGATTRDLNRSLRVLATLATVFFVLWYGASASRVGTFLLLCLSHREYPSLRTLPSKAASKRCITYYSYPDSAQLPCQGQGELSGKQQSDYKSDYKDDASPILGLSPLADGEAVVRIDLVWSGRVQFGHRRTKPRRPVATQWGQSHPCDGFGNSTVTVIRVPLEMCMWPFCHLLAAGFGAEIVAAARFLTPPYTI
jgi:hypothetical protein